MIAITPVSPRSAALAASCVHRDGEDRRAELFDGVDRATRQGRLPQCREERGPILDQKSGIVPHRLIGAEQVDFAGLPQTLRLPLPIARQGVADRLDRAGGAP